MRDLSPGGGACVIPREPQFRRTRSVGVVAVGKDSHCYFLLDLYNELDRSAGADWEGEGNDKSPIHASGFRPLRILTSSGGNVRGVYFQASPQFVFLAIARASVRWAATELLFTALLVRKNLVHFFFFVQILN